MFGDKLHCVDENKLKCVRCRKEQHFRCTGLPAYQVQMFLTKRYRSFVCVNCVSVSEELTGIVAYQEETIVGSLKRDVKACQTIVKSLTFTVCPEKTGTL